MVFLAISDIFAPIMKISNFKLLIILLTWLYNQELKAQERITTPMGQVVDVYSDGTWKYPTIRTIEDATGMIMVDADPLVAPRKEKYGMDERHTKGLNVLKDAVLSKEVNTYLSLIRNNSLTELMNSRLSLAIETNVLEHQEMFQDSVKHYSKLAAKDEKEIDKLTAINNKLMLFSDIKPKKRNKVLTSLGKKVDMDMSEFKVKSVSKSEKASSLALKSKLNYKPTIVCEVDSTFLGIYPDALAPKLQYWFSYTPIKMKQYFKSRNLLNGYCALTKIDGKEFLRLRTVISSKDAAKNYGLISEGSFMKLVFVTGKNVNIKAVANGISSLENYTGNTTIDVLFAIDKDIKRLFENIPIDTIGIMWSSGFEVYPIYEVDALINSVSCYEKL